MSFRKSMAVLTVCFTFLAAAVVPNLYAQQTDQAGSGLQLSPTRTDITAEPGEKKSITITLKNITQTDVRAEVFLNDFESDNQSGTPQIIVDNKRRTPYTLANILKNLNNVDLKAGETKELKVAVEVPAKTVPGAYFGALRYAAIPKNQTLSQAERQVALTASVAHLVFIEVPGEINQQIQIQSLNAQQNGKSKTFFFKPPDKVVLNIKNQGNGFSRPFGRVSMTGAFGKELHVNEVNNTNPRGIILPNSAKNFVNDLKKINMPGKYNLTASVAYGNGGEVVTYKSSFIYMPIWAILVLLLLLAAVGVGITYTYKKRFGSSTRRR